MAIKASSLALGQLKKFEGFSDKPYMDAKTGKMAIGYGDTEGDTSKPISEGEAFDRMLNRVGQAESELSKVIIRSDLDQAKQDALVDMHYNIGLNGMSEIINRVNGGASDAEISKALALYNKSTDVKTGQKYTVPALVERANYRSELWNRLSQPVTQQISTAQAAPSSEGDLLDGFIPQSPVNTQSKNFDLLGGFEPEPIVKKLDPKEQLDMAADSIGEYASAEILRVKEAQRLSQKAGISYDDAYTQLYTYSDKEIIARNAHDVIAKHFPGNTKWLQDNDENYVLMRDTGDYTRKVEAQTKPLSQSKKGDWEKVLGTNRVMIEGAATHLGMVLNMLNVQDGKNKLKEIDQKRQENIIVSAGAGRISEILGKKDFSISDLLIQFTKDPEAALQLAFQSQGSTVATILASAAGGSTGALAGGQIGAMTGTPLGAAAGLTLGGISGAASSAFAVSNILSFGEYMDGELEKFRNPETGIVDIDAAYSDAARVSRWRKEAAIYGFVMGTADAAFSMIGGKIGTAAAGKVFKTPATTATGKLATKVISTGAESLGKALEEGASQVAATSAVDINKGTLTPEKFKENIKEGKIEAAFALIPGTAAIVVKNTVTPKRSAEKTILVKAKESDKVTSQAVNVEAIRATVNAEETAKENKQQVAELINESLKETDTPEEVQIATESDLEVSEALIDSEIKSFNSAQESQMVELSPNEWDAMHLEVGEDPLEAMSKLSPEVQAAYQAHKGTDTSITIPLSQWVTYEPEELNENADTIIRVSGNNLNAKEAIAQSAELVSNANVLMSPFMPPIPGEEVLPPPFNPEQGIEGNVVSSDVGIDTQGITIIEPTGPEGNIIMRPIELINKARSDDERNVFGKILAAVKRVTKDSPGVDPKSLEVISEVQLRHMRHRASMLGVTLKELSDKLKFGMIKSDETAGFYAPKKYFDGIAKIAFGQYADAPTIIHEFGHSWIHEMAEDYEFINDIAEENLTDAQREYKQAMYIAAEHLNLKDMGELITLWKLSLAGDKAANQKFVAVHETFAQTSEMYFLKGKFANSKIQFLMNQFRKWMAPFLDSIGKTYKQFPPLKITPEIERMFDSILGASEKAEDAVVPMFGETLFDKNMLGPDGTKYMEVVDDAISEAIGETYTNITNKNYAEREKEINKAYNKIYAKAEQIVAQTNSMKMLDYFTQAYNDYKEGNISIDPRFSVESIAKVFFNDDIDKASEFKKTIPRAVIAGRKKGGLDVAQFMLINNIDNKEVMLKLIEDSAKHDEMVEAKVKNLVETEFPTFKTDDEIHQIAVDKMNSDGKEKLLLTEMKILATKYLPTLKGLAEKAINPASYVASASKKVLEAKALAQVANISLKQFNSAKFLRDSERQGREAAKKFRAGDIKATFDAKYLQAQNFFAYKISKKVERLIAKTSQIERKIYKFIPSTETVQVYDNDVINYGKMVIQAVREGLEIPKFTVDGVSKYSGLSASNIESINSMVEQFALNAKTNTGANLKVEGYLQYGQLLGHIVAVSKAAKQIEIAGEVYQIDNVAKAAGEQLRQGGNNVVSYMGDSVASKARIQKMSVSSLFKTLFKSDEDYYTSTLSAMDREVKVAESKRNFELTAALNDIDQALAKTTKRDPFLKSLYAPILRRGYAIFNKSWDKPVSGSELGITFKNETELDAAMLIAMGSESGMRKFLTGNCGVVPDINGDIDETNFYAMVNRLIEEGILTKEKFDFYQTVWNRFAPIHPMVSEAMRKVDGIDIGKIEGRPFTNKFGSYTGGYFPASPNKEFKTAQRWSAYSFTKIINGETNNATAHDMYPSRKVGLTKTRTDAVYPMDLDLRNVSRYLSTALNIAYLRVPLSSYEKVLHHPSVESVLEARRPGALSNVVIPHFERVKNQVYTEFSTDPINTIARYVRNNMNQVLYLGNLKSFVKQYLGLGQSLIKVGPSHLMRAALFTRPNPKLTRKFITDKSPIMAERFQNSMSSVGRSIEQLNTNFDWITWTSEKAKQLTFALTQISQNHVDTITWRAAYAQGMQKGMIESQAIAYADGIVEATQTSASVSNMTNLQAGVDLKKLFTQVLSVPIANSNMFSVELQRDQPTMQKMKGMVAIATYAVAVGVALELALSDEGEGTDEEELTDEEKLTNKLQLFTARAAGGSADLMFPMLSRLNSNNLGPVFGAFDKAQIAKQAVIKKSEGVDMTTKQFTSLMNTLTLFTGQGIFKVIGLGNLAADTLKTEDEKLEEAYTRQYQLEELRNKE